MDAIVSQPLAAELRKRALVVEANPAAQRLCRQVLERSGFVVDAAASGIQAVVCARTCQPDLILMDSQLPDVPCREAIGWLRSNPALRSMPIVVLNHPTADEAEFTEISPVIVIRKPISSQSLKRAIHSASTFDQCCA